MMRTAIAAVVVFGLGTATAGAQEAALEAGRQVYTAQKCQVCHSVAGAGNKKGPLDDVGARLSADQIREWIVDAPAMTAKSKAARKPAMKAYASIAKADLDALVAYLHSLKNKP